jgi:vacuolar-type H+-ATPase subunit E/Vma4
MRKKNEADLELKLRLAILEVKNQLVKEVKDSVVELVKDGIDANYDDYITYISNRIITSISTIRQNGVLFVNQRDHDYFENNSLPAASYELTLSPETLDMSGGFEIQSEDGGKVVRFTIDDLIDKNTILIASVFTKSLAE